MKKFILLLFPLFLTAQDLTSIMSPRLEEMAEKKKLIFAKSLPNALESTLRSLVAEEKWQPFFRAEMTEKREEINIESWVEAHKLMIAKKSMAPQEQLFSAKSDFVFFLRSWLPHLEQLPEDLQGEFLSEVAERYLDIFPPDREGSIHFLVESVTLELAHIS